MIQKWEKLIARDTDLSNWIGRVAHFSGGFHFFQKESI